MNAMRFVWTAGLLLLFAPIWGSEEEKDPLSLFGYKATKGSAAEYVPDKACSLCHMQIYQTYQHVGMSQSFARAEDASRIEDFGKEYYHEPSQRYYRIDKVGEELFFHRFMKDAAGKPIHQFKQRIHWVLGSGNRARSYLYQTPWGELYMLPLGWYSEDRVWGMSPGFEPKHHLGITRRVNRQCMFCHNALPETPERSDLHWETHQFPTDLPHGTGCQRCHGPGAEHIRAGIAGKPHETIRSLIVNPRKLPDQERDSVCFQCHMLPSVSLIGARRFDRADYSFRPGQLISDYLVHVEIDEMGESRTGRFEINHHGYRFFQSQCYSESKGKLACISCHNPHIKPESKAFRAEVSEVCTGCHPGLEQKHEPAVAKDGDCVSCHMPTRRTRDVVLTTMTDHLISRGPFDLEELVKPIEKDIPIITDVQPLPFGKPPTGSEAQLYRIISVLRNKPGSDAVNALERLLPQMGDMPITPYLDLMEGYLDTHRFEKAVETGNMIIKSFGPNFVAYTWLGVANIGLRKNAEARDVLGKALKIRETPTAHYNMGLALYGLKEDKLALEHLEKAIAMSPNMNRAWLYKGRVHQALGNLEKARDAYVRSLQLEPNYTGSYLNLVRLLRKMGDEQEAERYLEVGLRVAAKTEPLLKLKNPAKPN